MKLLWFGRNSSCRNITNAALEDGYLEVVVDSDNSLVGSKIRSDGEKEKRGRVVGMCGGAFFFLELFTC